MNRRGFLKLVVGTIAGLLVGSETRQATESVITAGDIKWYRPKPNWQTLLVWEHYPDGKYFRIPRGEDIDFYQDFPSWSEQKEILE